MKNMKLEQFLLTYNFRESNGKDGHTGDFDTQIIRIYLPNESFDTTNWFEFGVYHFDRGITILERIRKILNKEILNSYVGSLRTLDSGMLMVELTDYDQVDMD